MINILFDQERIQEIWEYNIKAEGRAEGKAEGEINKTVSYYKKGIIDADFAAKDLGISVKEVLELVEEHK